MKGASLTGLLIVLIIVGVIVYFVFFGSPAGQTIIPPKTFDNTIIQIADKQVTVRNPFVDAETAIIFSVVNAGDKKVDVDVNFDNVPNLFTIESLSCEAGVPSQDKRDCTFSQVESGDSRQVQLKLKANQLAPAQTSAQTTVGYSVGFHYLGSRFIQIPVVNAIKTLPSGIHYSVSSATVGPIQVSINPPAGSESTVNGQTVTENFARQGIPFTIKFDLSDVGNPPGTKTPVVLKGDQLNLTLKNLQIQQCDKIDAKTYSLRQTTNGPIPFPIPFNVECVMNDTFGISPVQAYDFGTITLDFNYDYRFENTETFTIRSLSP